MPTLTFAEIVRRQLTLSQHLTEALLARALAGKREQLDDFFLAQEHLEHWLQYLSPLGVDALETTLDAPPPLMRQAPPLPHEEEIYDGRARVARDVPDAFEPAPQPRVTFPPEPLWVDELERGPGEGEA